nr:hypothetical protein [Rhabdochromatium marinum]
MELLADAKAGFVQMLDARRLNRFANAPDKPLEALCAPGAEAREAGGCQLDAKQIRHQFDQPILGNKLIMQQIHHQGHGAGAVLHRRCHVRRELGSGRSATLITLTVVGAMLGHLQGLGRREIEDLPRLVAGAGLCR